MRGCRLEALAIYGDLKGLERTWQSVDVAMIKAPWGEATGANPMDRGKQSPKHSVLTDGQMSEVSGHCRQRLDDPLASTTSIVAGILITSGWRHVEVTEGYTARDFAQCRQAFVDTYFPKAALISVVLDNVNTHTPAILNETFRQQLRTGCPRAGSASVSSVPRPSGSGGVGSQP